MTARRGDKMTTQFTLTYHDHYITYKLTQHGYCYKYDSLTKRQVRISIETFWKAHKKYMESRK